MTKRLEVRTLEVGLLTAEPVESSGQRDELRRRHIPGLPVDAVQYWLCAVLESERDTSNHLVVMAHWPRLAEATCRQIATVAQPFFPRAHLSFTRESAEGHATITVSKEPAAAAAVVAETMRSGGWDESSTFTVATASEVFTVVLRWRQGGTTAEVASAA